MMIILLLAALVASTHAFWEPQDAAQCSGGEDPVNNIWLNITTFDGEELKLTQMQKTLISEWIVDPLDFCKFRVRIISKREDGALYIDSLKFSFGVHPRKKRSDRFKRSFELFQSPEEIRTQGFGSDKTETRQIPYAITDKDEDGADQLGVVVFKDGGTVKIRAVGCKYAVNWTPALKSTEFKLWGSRENYGNGTVGMAGNMNGDRDDDFAVCVGKDNEFNLDDADDLADAWNIITLSCEDNKDDN